jgi:hypothetical protein
VQWQGEIFSDETAICASVWLACEQLILIYEGVGSADHSYAPSIGLSRLTAVALGERRRHEANQVSSFVHLGPLPFMPWQRSFCSASFWLQPIRQGLWPGGPTNFPASGDPKHRILQLLSRKYARRDPVRDHRISATETLKK